jgi:hypothetical protein
MVGILLAHVGTKCSSQEMFEIYLQQILQYSYSGGGTGRISEKGMTMHGNTWWIQSDRIRSVQRGSGRHAACASFALIWATPRSRQTWDEKVNMYWPDMTGPYRTRFEFRACVFGATFYFLAGWCRECLTVCGAMWAIGSCHWFV